MGFEYKTIIIDNLMTKTETGMWMIPDNPAPGVTPPTMSEVRQMLWEDIRGRGREYKPVVKCIFFLVGTAIPEGWETVDEDCQIDGLKLRTTRSFGPMGGVTQVAVDSYEFRIRRLIE